MVYTVQLLCNFFAVCSVHGRNEVACAGLPDRVSEKRDRTIS